MWFFTEAQSLEGPFKSAGLITMDKVIKVYAARKLNNASKAPGSDDFSFKIKVTGWSKNGISQNENRRFTFVAPSRVEGEEWLGYLEYLKTKSAYEEFVSKYCPVQFPPATPLQILPRKINREEEKNSKLDSLGKEV